MSLADELRKTVRGRVDDSAAARDAASRDASLFRVEPAVVVTPEDAADVEAVVRLAAQKKAAGESVSVTARSAGTDMSGGPLNDSIILDMKGMNRFLGFECGPDASVGEPTCTSASAEPGMFFRDFDRETQKKDLELPSYTASRELNTLGGMAANNSGGEKNLKYGKTARYVEELDVVLSDGAVHTLRKLEGEALAKKLAETGFEGDLYRAVAKLVSENREVIAAAAPKVEKNSSGYALWDIGDGEKSLNLARLMVGAQGTLGIITKIRFRLVHPEPFSSMLVLFVKDLHDLGILVPEVLKHQPDSFESYDDRVVALVARYFPEFAAQMKSGLIGVALSFLPEVWMALSGGIPKIVLLVEFRGKTQEEALAKTRKLEADMERLGIHEKMHIAKDAAAARKYWVMRRETFNLLRKKVRGLKTSPFIDDFVVPPASLPEFLPKLDAILSGYRFPYAVSGHVGDGNFHIFPLLDPADPGTRGLIGTLSKEVYDLVLSYHGSITGEHNDGLIRTPYVEQMFGKKMYALFEETKRIFDPLDIFNPGKKVGMTTEEASEHLDLPAA